MGINLKKLAEMVEMDVSTISRALRDDPRVKEDTREKVKALAAKWDYRPNFAARHLVQGSSKTILFLLGSYSSPIEQIPVQQASHVLYEKNFDLISSLHYYDMEVMQRHIDRFSQGLCDGAIIIPPNDDGTTRDFPFPVVAIDRSIQGGQVPLITTDHSSAIHLMLDEYWNRGARQFMSFFGRSNSAAVERELSLFSYVRERGGLAITPDQYHQCANKSPLILCSSAQPNILDFIAQTQPQNELSATVFDSWNGHRDSLKQVMIAEQDFVSMANIAVDTVMKMIQKKKIKKLIQKIPISNIQII